MIDVRTAITLAETQYPTKRKRGGAAETEDMFVFSFVEKNATEEQIFWDNTAICVDKKTGECSKHFLTEPDVWEAKPIEDY